MGPQNTHLRVIFVEKVIFLGWTALGLVRSGDLGSTGLGIIQWGESMDGHTFGVLTNVDLITCVRECLTRAHCSSVNYCRKFRLCHLNDEDKGDIVQKNDFIFSDISTWTKLVSDECSKLHCNANEKCDPDSKSCKLTDCDPPGREWNADVYLPTSDANYIPSYSRIDGSAILYRCHSGYFLHGNNSVKCIAGQWNPLPLCEICPKEYNKTVHDVYGVVCFTVQQPESWIAAEEQCMEKGGHLLLLDSFNKTDILLQLWREGYLGDQNQKQKFWIDGQVINGQWVTWNVRLLIYPDLTREETEKSFLLAHVYPGGLADIVLRNNKTKQSICQYHPCSVDDGYQFTHEVTDQVYGGCFKLHEEELSYVEAMSKCEEENSALAPFNVSIPASVFRLQSIFRNALSLRKTYWLDNVANSECWFLSAFYTHQSVCNFTRSFICEM